MIRQTGGSALGATLHQVQPRLGSESEGLFHRNHSHLFPVRVYQPNHGGANLRVYPHAILLGYGRVILFNRLPGAERDP